MVERARAQDPTIQQLAVEVLNVYHKEVQAAQDNLENQELMQMLIAHRERRAKARAERLKEAATIANPFLRSSKQTSRPKPKSSKGSGHERNLGNLNTWSGRTEAYARVESLSRGDERGKQSLNRRRAIDTMMMWAGPGR